jgi:hypothetical protein
LVTALHVQLAPDNIGVNETDFDRILQVYPQPAVDRLVLVGKETVTVQIRLSDMNGKEVLHNTLDFSPGIQQTLDLSGLQSGVYLLQCVGTGGTAARRITVLR